MNSIELLQQIVEKYNFDAPIPPDAKQRSRRARKRTLVYIIRRAGHYGLFASLIITVYFFMKKIGLGISISKCVILVATAGIATSAVVGTGTYLTVAHIRQERAKTEVQEQEKTLRPDEHTEGANATIKQQVAPHEKRILPQTIEGLKQLYGRIDEITLYNGRVLQGAIISSGTFYTIVTTKGVEKIPRNKVRSKKIIE